MVARTSEFPHRNSPLIVTGDEELLEDLLRLTADAGLIADVAPDAVAARRRYDHAGLVIVGIDAAEACVRSGMRPRPGVILAGHGGDRPPPADWRTADRLGATYVALLPAAEPWLVDQMMSLGRGEHADVVAVLGGRGGAGASVLSGGLAVTGARHGLTTLLVDADPLGGGVDLVLGWEQRDGLRWPALTGLGGRVDPAAFIEALPGRPDLVVLSWDRGEPTSATPETMLAAIDAGRRGRDLVVIDLPRQLDETATMALNSADHGFLVVPAELRACAAAARVAAVALPYCPGLAVVVRQPAPGGLTSTDVAEAVGLPLAGSFHGEASVVSALERGEAPAGNGRGSLARLCEQLLTEIWEDQRVAA
jgi:secretion/DNA translocation related CpaE-like protein